jgi:hypothetical protein
VYQDSVYVADHTAYIPKTVVLIGAMIYVPAHLQVKLGVVPLVNRIVLAILRDSHIPVAQTEFSDTWIEGEPVYPAPCGVNQNGGRTVKHISCGNLAFARLQKILM